MANKTLEIVMLKEIIRHKQQGYSNKKIARIIGSSRTTVIKYLKLFEVSGFTYEKLIKLGEPELLALIQEQVTPSKSDESIRYSILLDLFPQMDKQLAKVGISRWNLWAEYKYKHPDGYSYSQFCYHFQQWRQQSEAYMNQQHKAGDKMFVDFTGKKLPYVDVETGEITEAEVFVAILGASQKTYVQACRSQKLEDFIDACQNALHYFGGVPRAIVPDNLKSAVIKSHKYEPVINENFAAFGQHYQTTILPARSLKPKDKALVEGAVRIIYYRIYSVVSKEQHEGLSNLNKAIEPPLETHNQMHFQKREYSREDLFETVDKPALGTLPVELYQIKHHKILKGQKNCHIYLTQDKHYYSFPFRYIGETLKVVYSLSEVEIYHKQHRIAYHNRNLRKYGYSTVNEHMPSAHRFVSEWSPDKFTSWAQGIGPCCLDLIQIILKGKSHPEQTYRSCLGVLSLAKKVGKHRLDKACSRAIHYQVYNYAVVKRILDQGLDKEELISPSQQSIPFHQNIRGKEYYN